MSIKTPRVVQGDVNSEKGGLLQTDLTSAANEGRKKHRGLVRVFCVCDDLVFN